jgi:predicted permease
MLDDFWRRIRYLLGSRRKYAEIEEEMRLHLALRAERLEAGGIGAPEAAAAAQRNFGNRLQLREASRRVWIHPSLDDLHRDLRIASRGLLRNPSFALVVVLTLALGIGANTAIFQLLNALRLRLLPVKGPEQLALIQFADREGWRGTQTRPFPTLTNPQWEYFRDHQTIFSGVIAWSASWFSFGAEPRPIRGLFVSGDFFRVLGVPPVVGRVFTAEEDRRGCGLPGAVVSYAFWKRELGGEPTVIGKKITLNFQVVEIVGVSESEFSGLEFGRGFDVAVPICSQQSLWKEGSWLDQGTVWWLTVMGRVPSSQRIESANARLRESSPAVFAATLPANYPRENVKDYLKMKLQATPGGAGVSDLRPAYNDPLLLLLATTCLVLLLACANLANLILARTSARAHEFTVRLAIGASRSHLLRLLMVENGVLALSGAVAGAFLAGVLSRYLMVFLGGEGDPLFLDLRPDARLVGFVTLVALVACLVFGLLPSWRTTRMLAGDVLKASTRSVAGSQFSSRMRQVLVVTQVALSLVILFGSLLFLGTLRNLLAVDAGFQHTGVVIAWLDYSRLEVPVASRVNFQRDLLETVRSVPGVSSAAESGIVPLSGASSENNLWPEGTGPSRKTRSNFNFVSAQYLKTMSITLLSGRDFDSRDTVSSPRVAIVNQTLARQLGFNGNPVGQRFRREATPSEPEASFEIIGLVPDTKYITLKEEFRPIALLSTAQDTNPGPFVQLVIRSGAPGLDIIPAIRSTIKTNHPEVGIDLRTFDSTIQESLLRERLMATVSGFFGALAVLIAAVGLYGVMSYLVIRRTNEIGIRVALGAKPWHVLGLILGRAGRLVTIGIACGAVAAVAAAQAARSLLFELQPYDIKTLGLTMIALIVVGLAASYVPARRAMGLEPVAALRQE